jgi:hypothetical protein
VILLGSGCVLISCIAEETPHHSYPHCTGLVYDPVMPSVPHLQTRWIKVESKRQRKSLVSIKWM